MQTTLSTSLPKAVPSACQHGRSVAFFHPTARRGPGSIKLASGVKDKLGVVRSRRCPRLQPSLAAAVDAEGAEILVPVTIRVTQHVNFGEVLKIAGVVEELGAWDLTHAPKLTWGDGDVWTAELELPQGHHDYKLVIHNENDDIAYWEMCSNHVLKVTGMTPCTFSLEFNGKAEEVEPDTAEELVGEEPAPEVTEAAAPVEVVAEAAAATEAATPTPVVEEPVTPEVAAPAAQLSSSSSPASNGISTGSAEKAKHAAVAPDAQAFNPTPTEITTGEVAEEKAALKSALAAKPKPTPPPAAVAEPKPTPPPAAVAEPKPTPPPAAVAEPKPTPPAAVAEPKPTPPAAVAEPKPTPPAAVAEPKPTPPAAAKPKPAPPPAATEAKPATADPVTKPEASKAESVMQRVSGLKKAAAKRSVRAVSADPNVRRL